MAAKTTAKKTDEAEVIAAETETKQEAAPAVIVEPDVVTICCNYPRDVKFDIPLPNGKVKSLTINGNANHLRGKAKGVLPVGAYGFTPNVPRELWDALCQSRPDDPLLKSGCIFAVKGNQAADAAAERKEVRNGFEPLEPSKNFEEVKGDA